MATRPSLFISDLHLPPGPSPLREAFVAFLQGPARDASALYILGDLFEYWIGDDVGLQVHAREIAELAVLAQTGVRIAFLHGNRDFMVDGDFAQITGVTLLQDPLQLRLHGVPTLISHGDIYCTDDVRYQRWRRQSRRPLLQWLILRMPRSWRERAAANLRARSAQKLRDTPDLIMDVNEDAIRAAFREHGVARMIHGHTHRPQTHRYEIDGVARERIVLADWRPGQIEYLRVDEAGAGRVTL